MLPGTVVATTNGAAGKKRLVASAGRQQHAKQVKSPNSKKLDRTKRRTAKKIKR